MQGVLLTWSIYFWVVIHLEYYSTHTLLEATKIQQAAWNEPNIGLGFCVSQAYSSRNIKCNVQFLGSRGKWEAGYNEILLLPLMINVLASVYYYAKVRTCC